MHMMPNAQAPEAPLSPLAAGLVRGRFWLYLALTLLAIMVIAAGKSARQPEGRMASNVAPAARAAQPGPLAPPADDRPLLLPDR